VDWQVYGDAPLGEPSAADWKMKIEWRGWEEHVRRTWSTQLT
jgi:hypothetical protein